MAVSLHLSSERCEGAKSARQRRRQWHADGLVGELDPGPLTSNWSKAGEVGATSLAVVASARWRSRCGCAHPPPHPQTGHQHRLPIKNQPPIAAADHGEAGTDHKQDVGVPVIRPHDRYSAVSGGRSLLRSRNLLLGSLGTMRSPGGSG
jgi:hypothetical protein